MADDRYLIRPLRVDDKPQWARLWQDYLTFYGTELPEAVYDSTFERLLVPGTEQPACFVAEAPSEEDQDASALVGLVHYLYHPHCWKLTPVCYLQDLFVDPEHRGQRLGRLLIERVYAQASEDGAPDVYWLTQDFNREARQLYDRVGMQTPFIKYVRPPQGV